MWKLFLPVPKWFLLDMQRNPAHWLLSHHTSSSHMWAPERWHFQQWSPWMLTELSQCEETGWTWQTDALASRWLCNPELGPCWHSPAVTATEWKIGFSIKKEVGIKTKSHRYENISNCHCSFYYKELITVFISIFTFRIYPTAVSVSNVHYNSCWYDFVLFPRNAG